jgi:hypothetical protein
MSSIITWCRDEEVSTKKNRPIEEKESIRWINTALSAKQNISNAGMITVVGDRESDIFEIFERIPDQKTHLIVRASHDRKLADGEKISEFLAHEVYMGTHELRLRVNVRHVQQLFLSNMLHWHYVIQITKNRLLFIVFLL